MSKRAWVFVLLGATVLLWYYYHKNCPVCQERWRMMKNRFASNIIEPKPEGA